MEVRPATQDEVMNALAASPPLVRVALDMSCCATADEVHSNFYATLDRGFEPVNAYLGKEKGTCSIVGSAPSIRETYTEIVGDVLAINSAISFLLDNGVVPKWAMLWDAAEVVEQFAIPHPDVTYLVASRCHPKVFERLKDCKVVVWHAGGDHDIAEVLCKPEVIEKMPLSQPLINGGSAGVTRGLFVANALGYDDMHIFGADSSYRGDDTHVRGSVVPEKSMMTSLGEGSSSMWFRTTPEWCQQVNEYRSIYALYSCNGVKLQVHGDGLLKAMHERLEAKKELQGKDKFLESIAAQEIAQHELNMAASQLLEVNHACV